MYAVTLLAGGELGKVISFGVGLFRGLQDLTGAKVDANFTTLAAPRDHINLPPRNISRLAIQGLAPKCFHACYPGFDGDRALRILLPFLGKQRKVLEIGRDKVSAVYSSKSEKTIDVYSSNTYSLLLSMPGSRRAQ
jgi:hypothetical protein